MQTSYSLGSPRYWSQCNIALLRQVMASSQRCFGAENCPRLEEKLESRRERRKNINFRIISNGHFAQGREQFCKWTHHSWQLLSRGDIK